MKRNLYLLLSFLILASPIPSFSKSNSFEKEIEKKIECPSSFLANPPVYFYCIYRDYHNHHYDDGIKKAEAALKEVWPLYEKNPKGLIPNSVNKKAKLKDPHLYKVVSDLHMLLGMLLYQKSMNLKDNSSHKIYVKFYDKLQKKGFDFVKTNELMMLYTMKKLFPSNFDSKKRERYKELLKEAGITEKDLDSFNEKVEKASEKLDQQRLSLLKKAVNEFKEAIKTDPNNALAYYQLGNLLSGALSESTPQDSQSAEYYYYKAALLLKKEGDLKGYKEVLRKLEIMNPNSKYLKLLRGKSDV